MLYSREPFDFIIDELEPLIKAHHYEIDWLPEKIKLDVDKDFYRVAESQGILMCFSARDRNKLCGYASFFIQAHPHYKTTRYAVNDALYVRPENRGGTGRELIQFCESELVAFDIQVITYNIKNSLDWGKLASQEGYEPTEMLWQKWVGG